MGYPTSDQVEKASQFQLARWYRFLKSPGYSAIGKGREQFGRIIKKEKVILDRIIERFTEMGGFNPALSKHIGWEA